MTGEMSWINPNGLDSNGDEWPNHAELAKRLGGELRAFDKYQGPYIRVGRAKLWLFSENGIDGTLYCEDTDTRVDGLPLDDDDAIERAARHLLASNMPEDTPEYREALSSAILEDHPCEDCSCDIAMARESEFVYSAAHLLMGATESPNVDRVVAEHGGLPPSPSEGWPIDWDDWTDWYRENTWNCPACNGHTHKDSDTCGNCLEPKPEPEPEPKPDPLAHVGLDSGTGAF